MISHFEWKAKNFNTSMLIRNRLLNVTVVFIVCFKSCLKDKALVKLFCPLDWNMLWQSTGQAVNGSYVAISLMRNLARTLIWTLDCLCIKHNDKSESSLKSHPTLIDLYIRWLCQKIILKAHLYSLFDILTKLPKVQIPQS